jgi:PhnB protein
MKAAVKPIPDGFHSITPYLTVNDGRGAIEFYQRAFGAKERFSMKGPDGKSIGHAEIVIGNSILMLADESPMAGNKSPKTLNGTPVSLLIYVENVDSAFKQAIDAGASVVYPVENKFYGERSGCLKDPFGHIWTLMTHIEDVTSEELNRRMNEFCAKMGDGASKTS